MKITKFEISQDRLQINLEIIDAATITSLVFWTDVTFRNYSQSIDLSSKLTGSSTENITITLGDISLPYFDGIYFIEAEGPDELSLSISSDLTKYKECILSKLMTAISCDDCLKTQLPSITNAQTLLVSLGTAIESAFIDEISLLFTALKKYCSDDCKTCGEFKNIVDVNYYSS